MKNCIIKKCDSKHYAKGLCQHHYQKMKYKKEPEKFKNRSKKWNVKNKNIRIKYARKWKKNNPNYFKNYYKMDKEKHNNRTKKYQKDHPEKMLEYNKKRLEKLGKEFDMTSMKYLYALQAWSQTIKKRDNYMCKNCGSKKNLNAHHIKPKSEYPELSLDLDNGVTLCEKCHGKKHGFEIY